jgi:hypothetical protein
MTSYLDLHLYIAACGFGFFFRMFSGFIFFGKYVCSSFFLALISFHCFALLADEFTARTGFGNAVALLQLKGLC